jgi:hypothetical protein
VALSDAPKVAVLLGAGASKDAGIPTTEEMTEAIISRMQYAVHVRLLDFIQHTLAADQAARTPASEWTALSPVRPIVDVERLFAAVDLLIDRHDQPWSPFVATWSAGLDSFAPPQVPSGPDLRWDLQAFDQAIRRATQSTSAGSLGGFHSPGGELASALEKALRRVQPGDVSALLRDVRNEMLTSLVDIVNVRDPSMVGYLKPLATLARRQSRLTVATLNYDLAVETMVNDDNGVDLQRTETWQEEATPSSTKPTLHLMKLHGSIDWVISESTDSPLPLRLVNLRTGDSARELAGQPAVVFGEGGKLRAEGPFLELLLGFSNALNNVDRLLIVGYSFRDDHVNELIARWFANAPSRKIILLDPSEIERDPRNPFTRQLGWLNAAALRAPDVTRRFHHVQETTATGLSGAIKIAEAV